MKIRIPAIHFLTMQLKAGFVGPVVEVANQYPALQYDPQKLLIFFESVFSVHQHNLSGELSVVFMDRSSHSQLHGKYLQDFRPTDVITFPADQENGLAGEICVSVDQAIEESELRNLSFEHELALYLIHGWLHLVGFDDLEKVDQGIMRQEEVRVMDHVKKLSTWPDFRLAPQIGGL
jgi:probable rRNA maturation factor